MYPQPSGAAGRTHRRMFTAYGCRWTGQRLERLGRAIGDATGPGGVSYVSDRGGTTLRRTSLAKLRSALWRLPRPGDPAVVDTLRLEAAAGGRRVQIVMDAASTTVVAEGRDAPWVEGVAAQVRDLFVDSGGSLRPIRYHQPFCVAMGLLLGIAGALVLMLAGWVPAEGASLLATGSAIVLLGAMGVPIGRRRSLRARTTILLNGAHPPPGPVPMSRSDLIAFWSLAVAFVALAVTALGVLLAHADAQHEPAPASSGAPPAPRR